MRTLTKEEWAEVLGNSVNVYMYGSIVKITALIDKYAEIVHAKLAELQENDDKAVAQARLRAFVDARKTVCESCSKWRADPRDGSWGWGVIPSGGPGREAIHNAACLAIGRRIAAWHAEHDPPNPKCDHDCRWDLDKRTDGTKLLTCTNCKATRLRGWLGEWREAKPT